MNTYEQQLKEILNPKGCGKDFSSGNAPYICGKDKWIEGYDLCPTCKERIKTKLQEWHKMASLIKNRYCRWKNEREEVEVFIQEIEKIAKEQGVELK